MNKNYINEHKYRMLDIKNCNELTNDDLVCILFGRFKNARNSLYLNMLNIHKELINPKDNNKNEYRNNNRIEYRNNNYKNNYNEKNKINLNTNTFI